MSQPISSCLIAKAARDEEAYRKFLEIMKYNWSWGHWTQFPCTHEPKCSAPTDEEMKALNDKLKVDFDNWKAEGNHMGMVYDKGKEGEQGQ